MSKRSAGCDVTLPVPNDIGHGDPPKIDVEAAGAPPNTDAEAADAPPNIDADAAGAPPNIGADAIGGPANSELDVAGDPPNNEWLTCGWATHGCTISAEGISGTSTVTGSFSHRSAAWICCAGGSKSVLVEAAVSPPVFEAAADAAATSLSAFTAFPIAVNSGTDGSTGARWLLPVASWAFGGAGDGNSSRRIGSSLRGGGAIDSFELSDRAPHNLHRAAWGEFHPQHDPHCQSACSIVPGPMLKGTPLDVEVVPQWRRSLGMFPAGVLALEWTSAGVLLNVRLLEDDAACLEAASASVSAVSGFGTSQLDADALGDAKTL